MLKSELIELLNNIDDNADVDEEIFNNYMTFENFRSRLDSDAELKKKYDEELKKQAIQAVNDFKAKGMQKIIDAEVIKRTNVQETPEQKQIRELRERLDASDKENARTKRVSKFKDVLSAKNIPNEMIDFLIGEDDDVTNANIDLFENNMKIYIENQVKERMSKGSYTPPASSADISGKITWDQVQENPEKYYEKWVAQQDNNK